MESVVGCLLWIDSKSGESFNGGRTWYSGIWLSRSVSSFLNIYFHYCVSRGSNPSESLFPASVKVPNQVAGSATISHEWKVSYRHSIN